MSILFHRGVLMIVRPLLIMVLICLWWTIGSIVTGPCPTETALDLRITDALLPAKLRFDILLFNPSPEKQNW